MRSRSRELMDRAIAATVAAIDVYNKPDFKYRAESFSILALNGWELLLKAKWLADNNNKLPSLYVPNANRRTRFRYKRTRSGNHMTYSLDYLADRLVQGGALDDSARQNLLALTELRDTAVHFYHTGQLAETVQETGTATLKNFAAAVQDWFAADLSMLNLFLMPLSFVTPQAFQAVTWTPAEMNFLKYVYDMHGSEAEPTDRYSVLVNIDIRFARSQSGERAFTTVSTRNDPGAVPIHLSDEQMRERFPWDYAELTEHLSSRYEDFKVNQKYHRLRLTLANDSRFAYIRRLDPDNPRSQKKVYFNTNIVRQFDPHYTLR